MSKNGIVMLILVVLCCAAFPAAVGSMAQTCEPYCYPPPDPEPCVGSDECYGSPSESGNSPIWSGFIDDRLNPRMDEYYSVWCEFDLLKIYRVVPETLLIKTVPIRSMIALDIGASLDLGDFMTAVRNTADTVTIYGSNGNLSPEPGEKAFSLNECRERSNAPASGSTPVENTVPPVPPSDDAGTSENVLTCSVLLDGTSGEDTCAFFTMMSGSDSLDFLEALQLTMRVLGTMCAGVFILPGAGLFHWLRQRHRETTPPVSSWGVVMGDARRSAFDQRTEARVGVGFALFNRIRFDRCSRAHDAESSKHLRAETLKP